MAEQVDRERRNILKLAAKTIAMSQLGALTLKSSQSPRGSLPSSLRGATAWLNSQPLTMSDLRDKVVVVDFWTYSCINWRRTLPYIRGWANKYKDNGLILIGVHTPEFEFEKEIGNVRQAIKAMKIDYPVVMDNDYAIWRAFNNEYWPALYFLDGNWHLRANKFGEGDYDQSERTIQQLLVRTRATNFNHQLLSVDATGAEAPADWSDLQSGENYLGSERTQNFASPGGLKTRKPNNYASPAQLKLNHWALSGDWAARKDAIVSIDSHARIAYQFHARDLHLVMGPARHGDSVKFRVRLDGSAPGAAHGVDNDEQGCGVITEPRMYQLVRQSKPIIDRRVEVEFVDSGAKTFSFTFG